MTNQLDGGQNDSSASRVSETTKAMQDQIVGLIGYSDLNDIQRAGIYLLLREVASVCHGSSPHKFQNLAYVLGVIDAEDIKKTLMEAL
jgi:spore maturation protein SpmB